MEFNKNNTLEKKLEGIKSLLIILNNNIEKTSDDLEELKDSVSILHIRIDSIDNKLKKTNEKIDGELLEECKKMGSHIDFVENVYDNVKHPLGFICNKIKYLAGGSNDEQYSLTNVNNESDSEGEHADDEKELIDSE